MRAEAKTTGGKRKRGARSLRAFVLLEAMLGVAIFAIGILALANCVNNCLVAETVKVEDSRARLALQNRMAEIESGAFKFEGTKTEKLTGMFDGITLKQTRVPLKLETEKKEKLLGLYNVTIQASWESGGQPQSKAISFYVFKPM